jgi:SAM-dependent methyltransferase
MIRVLQNESQITQARENLQKASLDTSQGWWRKRYEYIHRLRMGCWPIPVAMNKSWDVWSMYTIIRDHVTDYRSQVFDMGSYNSEIPLVLSKSGYQNIRASDLNPLGRMICWYGRSIDFRCENFYEPDLAPQSVAAMTALSVIEHGYDQAQLIATAKRLLRPGGLLLITTDYHEEKIVIPDTFRPFDMSYQIFSKADVESLLHDANQAGFELVDSAEWANSEHPIRWEGMQYTFVMIGLRKR